MQPLKTVTPWGEIGYPIFKRTYARRLVADQADSSTEEFHDTVKRVVDASNSQLGCGFNEQEKEKLSSILLGLKGIVAGRFLWQLGTPTIDRLGLLSLQNCAFVIVDNPVRPFTWAMDALMLGSGVGFNIQRHNVYQLPRVHQATITRVDSKDADFIVPDSREGWVQLLGKVMKAHFYGTGGFTFSTMLIRGFGAPIKSFGGTASGPEALCAGLAEISKVLNKRAGQKVRPIDCLDVMNIIGQIVVAGNVRRSAQIAIGDPDDVDFLKAKRWDLGSVPSWRANSNNSVACSDIKDLHPCFWDTYAQGEPYGLINLKLSRAMGRLGETQYPDPEVEGYNPCVTGDTEILTKKGYQRIDSLVDQDIEIWNGFEWSAVTPKVTGHNQHLIKITLSDGRELTSTDYHKWYLAKGYTGVAEQVTTKDLKIGDKIIKHSFPVITSGENIDAKIAYTQGFISAEGMDDYSFFWLYDTKYMCKDRLDIKSEGNEYRNFAGIGRKSIYYNGTYEDKSFVPYAWNLSAKLQWIAGLMDGDGTELKEGGSQICSVDKSFLSEVQKLLSTLGVNCKVVDAGEEGNRMMPDGKGGLKEYFCQKSFRLLIGSVQMQQLKELGLHCERLSFDKSPQRDATQFVKVVKIEDAGYAEEVYCFNEPLRHYGVFNGILTGQCAEQGLANHETCCLAEVFLPNITSKEEFIEVATYLYRVCKHSMALPCHLKETEAIVHKNMRMGIGVTGVLQATEEQRSWLSDTYKALREYDAEYSAKHGWPASIKLTTTKPSGTLSLLAGVTPGAHPNPAGPYYYRRVRMAVDSPLLALCEKHGFPIEWRREFDGSNDHTTKVVTFPCSVPEHTPIAADYSAIQQLEFVKWMQTNWSDNAVSVTVTYKTEELDLIKEWLSENYASSTKSVSFLLYQGHGFDQAPYETISKEEYLRVSSKTTPITALSDISEKSMDTESDCVSGACPIK